MDSSSKRRLGKSGLELPIFGLGGGPLGEMFERLDEAQAWATVETAWGRGVRYFDTSPWYGRGLSEHRIGRFLCGQDRDGFLLATKVGRILKAPPVSQKSETGFWSGGLPFNHHFDYSYDGVMRSFEDSIQRLGVPRVDMLLIHDLDWYHHGSEANVSAHFTNLATGGWRALSELKSAGVIKAIGAGINQNGLIPRFLESFDLDFFLLALRYTLAEQDTADAELPLCVQRGVGLVIGGIYNSGILATGARPGAKYNYEDAGPDIMAKVSRIERICNAHGVPLAAAALQFPLGHPSVTSVIPGAISPEQVIRNLENLSLPIPGDLWRELRHEGLVHPAAPLPA